MRDVSPSVDGFEVQVGGLRTAGGRTSGAAGELDAAVASLRSLALTRFDVGPSGGALLDAVARYAARAADRLATTASGLDADGRALGAAADTYGDTDRWFAHELELLT